MTERLFVAIWPTTEVRDAVQAALAPLPGRYPELRWQSPDRWHITVGFLGDRDPRRELNRFSRLEMPAAHPIQLEGSGRFGPVLWLGVRSGDWLAALAGSVHKVMRSPDRRFRGHVTIARSRSSIGARHVARAVTDLAEFQSPAWVPAEATLVRSNMGPQPSYEVIGRTPLTADGQQSALDTL